MSRHLLVVFCFFSLFAEAQTNLVTGGTLDAYWNLPTIPTQTQATLRLSTASLPAASSQNEVVTRQEGGANTAMLSVLSGAQNRLEVNQYTGLNFVDATLTGVNNSVLLNQTGTGNSISFGLNGSNNQYVLAQDGGDRIQMQGLQKNNERLEVKQGYGNNSLTLDNTNLFQGSGIPNLHIEQTGGASITIQQGKVIGN
ncbi:hypothetical protein [Spirosoma validum]|uniref:Curlin associated repeat-containing protein n=1 Tax=Spirosoma validum TaxID=2771355 RepID=A0A927GCY4_9BACT|nr:hypothetical protein [Spirosoma validum]MBD2753144.1 hypothetical protein [Spirosoma validum]